MLLFPLRILKSWWASTNNKWVSQKWENAQSPNGDIIYTSTDGGTTWRSLQDSMVLTNNGVTWVPGYALHWCGSMCFDPSNDSKVSFASGNGIFTCNNVWCKGIPTFYFDVNGLEETVALDMVSIPGGNPQSVIGDYTGFNHTSVSEFAPIHVPSPGTSNGIAYAAGNTKVMARVSRIRYGAVMTSYYSEDGGKTWSAMKNPSGSKVALSADGQHRSDRVTIRIRIGSICNIQPTKVRLSATAQVLRLSLMWRPTLSIPNISMQLAMAMSMSVQTAARATRPPV
jgi:hypothetical protein